MLPEVVPGGESLRQVHAGDSCRSSERTSLRKKKWVEASQTKERGPQGDGLPK